MLIPIACKRDFIHNKHRIGNQTYTSPHMFLNTTLNTPNNSLSKCHHIHHTSNHMLLCNHLDKFLYKVLYIHHYKLHRNLSNKLQRKCQHKNLRIRIHILLFHFELLLLKLEID